MKFKPVQRLSSSRRLLCRISWAKPVWRRLVLRRRSDDHGEGDSSAGFENHLKETTTTTIVSQGRAALAAVVALAPLAKRIAAAAALPVEVAVVVPGLVALKVDVAVLAAAPAPVDGPQVAVLAAAALVAAPAPVDGPQVAVLAAAALEAAPATVVAGLVALAIAAKTAVTAAITAARLYPKNGIRDSDFSPKREQPRRQTPSTSRY
jgi:hypothetical protein